MIFAQAAGTPIVYVATTDPSPNALAILKPADSKVAIDKGISLARTSLLPRDRAHITCSSRHSPMPACPMSR